MSETLSAVVAGSKGFVDAVQAHLKVRLGALAQVARDPQEALGACADKGGLLVLEYAGSPWLEVVKDLRGLPGGGTPLSIVAAVAPAQSADAEPLRRAGVDQVVSWQGRVDPVIWAVDRVMDRPRAPGVPAAPPKLTLVRDDDAEAEKGFELREIPVGENPADPAASAPVLARFAAPLAAANQVAPEALAVPWPGAVPSAAAAEALLLSVVAGRAAADESHIAAAERVLAAASELERSAFSGGDVPLDPALLRAATGLRLRLDLAIATLPPAGEAFDQPAAQQLLAEVDGVLGQVRALGNSAPAGVVPALEPTRLAIVDGGVRLAGALSGLVPVGEGQPAAPAMPARAPAARILSNEKGEDEAPRRSIVLWVALVLALTVAVAFHANRYLHPAKPSGPGHLSYSPEGSVATPGPGQSIFVISPAGRFEPAEVEKFKAREELKGNTVQQVAPGTLVVVRGAVGGGTKGGGP